MHRRRFTLGAHDLAAGGVLFLPRPDRGRGSASRRELVGCPSCGCDGATKNWPPPARCVHSPRDALVLVSVPLVHVSRHVRSPAPTASILRTVFTHCECNASCHRRSARSPDGITGECCRAFLAESPTCGLPAEVWQGDVGCLGRRHSSGGAREGAADADLEGVHPAAPAAVTRPLE
jgi:hypothetical protein